jgi:hypothetical protein
VQDSLCPNCGHADKALRGAGLTFPVTETSIDLIPAILKGELDQLRCGKCNYSLGISPTFLLIFSGPPRAFVFAGTRVKSQEEELIRALEVTTLPLPVKVEYVRLQTLEEVRDVLAKQVKTRLSEFNAVLIAQAEDKLAEYLQTSWRELTPERFAAASVSLCAPIPGVQIAAKLKTGEQPGVQDALEHFGETEAKTWLAAWMAWTARKGHGKTLEEDLHDYFHRDVVFPGAIEKCLDYFEGVQEKNPNLSFQSEFCLEAMRATLHQMAGGQNPRSEHWAKMFFKCEFARRIGDPQDKAITQPLAIANERAAATILYQDAWNAAIPYLDLCKDPEKMKILEETTEACGHPGLLEKIFKEGLTVDFGTAKPLEVILEVMQSMAKDGPQNLIAPGQEMMKPILASRDGEAIETIANELARLRGGGREAQARSDAWAGEQLNLIRQPERFFKRVGAEARPWEDQLEPLLKAKLCLERSNHLRLMGKTDEALRYCDEAIKISAKEVSESDRRVQRRNRAILLREAGKADASAEEIRELLKQAEGLERIQLLDSLAVSESVLGKHERALEAVNEAILLAKGPAASHALRLRPFRAVLRIVEGSVEEAEKELIEIGPQLATSPEALIAAGSAWASFLGKGSSPPVSDEAADAIGKIHGELWELVLKSRKNGDVQLEMNSLRLHAFLSEGAGLPQAEKAWEAVYARAEEYEQQHGFYELLALARISYQKSDVSRGRSLLAQLPLSTAASLGGVQDITEALRGSENLGRGLGEVATAILKQHESFADIRLIAEMKRDTLARAANLRRRGLGEKLMEEFRDGISDSLVERLAPKAGRVGVMEWLETGNSIGMFVTLIDADRTVRSHWLRLPQIDLGEATRKLKRRLGNWTLRRTGDPFEIDEWKSIREWLKASLDPWLREGDHVVVIETADYAGFPWHVAAAPQWSCSYASGWTALLASEGMEKGPKDSLGVILVPRARDTTEVRSAMENSADRTQAFAGRTGRRFLKESGGEADRKKIEGVFENSQAAKLLCHGYVNPQDHEVALMVAAGGDLPTATEVAEESPSGDQHRFSWRDAAQLRKAPRVVFSAACSSGVSYMAGVGERLGLLAGLRGAGTRALVAPQWDIVPQIVLPILDDALESYYQEELTLAQAVHAACKRAEKAAPRWLAWSLATEGDWR